MQLAQQAVFVFPQLIDPALKGQFVLGILIVVAPQKLSRNAQLFKHHHDLAHVAAQQIPVTGAPAGVVNGHVDDGFQLLAHGVQHKGNTARLGLEQVAKR